MIYKEVVRQEHARKRKCCEDLTAIVVHYCIKQEIQSTFSSRLVPFPHSVFVCLLLSWMINNSIVDRQGPSPWYALVNRCSCLDHSEWEKLYLTRVICGSLSLEFVAVQCFSGIVLISPALSVFFLCLTCVAGCTVCIWAPLFPCLIQLLFHHITFHFPHFFSSPHGDSRVPSQLILPHSD